MRTRPQLSDADLLARLQAAYGLDLTTATFLPLGADYATALYRITTRDGTPFFCRLRSGPWDEIAVALPAALHAAGVREVPAPVPALDEALSVPFGPYRVSLLPWLEARNAYEVPLTDAQWVALGAAVRRIHEAALPEALLAAIPLETYPSHWRERLGAAMAGLEAVAPIDELAREAIAGLRTHQEEIAALLARTEALAAQEQAVPHPLVVCHTDLHAGNVLVTSEGELFIVDWDAPLRAPRERDLMYAGGGQFGNHRTLADEQALFSRGYGDAVVDRDLLAYYRYARVIEDLAIYADDLLHGDTASPDRADALRYMLANFEVGGTLAIARAGDGEAAH